MSAFTARLRSETAATLCSGTVSSCDISVRSELAAWGALSQVELDDLNSERIEFLVQLEREARNQIGMDVCSAGMAYSTCEAAIDTEIDRQRQLNNRIGGAIDIVFGTAETVSGLYFCGQTAGISCTTASLALVVHGSDTASAGALTLYTGETALPLGTQLLMRFGLNETQASLAYDLVVVGFELNAVRALASQGDGLLQQTHTLFSDRNVSGMSGADLEDVFDQGTIGGQGVLRERLIEAFPGLAHVDNWQAHHIIPWALLGQFEFLDDLNFNSISNAIPLPRSGGAGQTIHDGPHQSYNDAWDSYLASLNVSGMSTTELMQAVGTGIDNASAALDSGIPFSLSSDEWLVIISGN